MTHFDVFNGDADGIFARHQLRLATPVSQVTLITGVKRDNALLARVPVTATASIHVFDVSYDKNADAAEALLAAGATLVYFDHHRATRARAHAGLLAHIDTAADQCTSLIVDRVLGGRSHRWAIAAAFGDGLTRVAEKLATAAALDHVARAQLRELGELFNYNAYGESEADLFFRPADLAAHILPFADPFVFMAETTILARLRAGYAADMRAAIGFRAEYADDTVALFCLPDLASARRVSGVFANHLADTHPTRAHAVLTPVNGGGLTVSLRAPRVAQSSADVVATHFGGGGRAGAAGIDGFAVADIARLIAKMQSVYAKR